MLTTPSGRWSGSSGRRVLATSVAALALGSLAACNNTPSAASDPTTAPPTSSAPVTSNSSTPTVSSTPAPVTTPTSPTTAPSTPSTPASGGTITPAAFAALIKGAFDKATTAKVTEKTTGTSALAGGGVIDFTTSPPQEDLTLKSAAFGNKAIEARLVKGVLYIQSPQAGGKFYSIDLSDPSNPLAKTFGDSLDPSATIQGFADAVSSVKDLGQTSLGGETVHHYLATADAQKLMNAIAPGTGKAAATELPKNLTYDVYFDTDGLFRELTAGLGKLGNTTIDFTDWGSKVSISAPPASQVEKFPGS